MAFSLAIGGDAETSADGDVVATNFGDTVNDSDGEASITTGDATAYGNASVTSADQVATVDIIDGDFTTIDQEIEVTNEGEGEAETGDNDATGNDSDNDADTNQTATLAAQGGDADAEAIAIAIGGDDLDIDIDIEGDATVDVDGDVTLANTSDTSNRSTGSAAVDTGDARAKGNYSATNVAAEAWVTGEITFVDQELTIDNVGDADADSGDNEANGNTSDNETETEQEDELVAEGDDEDITVDRDLVAANAADTTNESDGLSDIASGDADAEGNVAVNSACSGVNVDVDCEALALPVLPPPPPPPCPCRVHEEAEPELPTQPPVQPAPGPVGEELPVTGGPLTAQVAVGVLLIALGRSLRRRSSVA